MNNENGTYLRLYSEYENSKFDYKVKFIYNYRKLKILNKKLHLNVIAGSGSELEKIYNLLSWTNKNLKFEGKKIIERVFDNCTWFEIVCNAKKQGYSFNCRYLTLLFTQMLLSQKFRARVVICLPIECITKERHCITEVYIEEFKKWIVIDATFGLIYYNKEGKPLSLIEMRDHIINDKEIRIFTKNAESREFVWESWKKHIFRFQYYIYNGYNMFYDNKQNYVFLNPKNFLSYDEISCKKNKTKYFDNIIPFLEK